MGYKLAPIVLGFVLAACSGGAARMHTVDVVTDDGALVFEIKMNGCWVYDAVVHNRSNGDRGGIGTTLTVHSAQNPKLGSINMTFPATRAGGRARADGFSGSTGLFRTGRDFRTGPDHECKYVDYTLRYY